MSAAEQRPPFTLDDLAGGYLFDPPPPGRQAWRGPLEDGGTERAREMYRLRELGLTDVAIGRLYGVTSKRIPQILNRFAHHYGGNLTLSAQLVPLLRAGLLASLREPSDVLRQVSAIGPRDGNADKLSNGLRLLGSYCDLLRHIGADPPKPELPVEVDLAIHRWALVPALLHQLWQERSEVRRFGDGRERDRRDAERRARRIERFLRSVPTPLTPASIRQALLSPPPPPDRAAAMSAARHNYRRHHDRRTLNLLPRPDRAQARREACAIERFSSSIPSD